MYLSILFCIFMFSCRENSSAFTRRRCNDCVSILSCEAALNFTRRTSQGDVSPQSKQIFNDAICDTDSDHPTLPKICCSAFSMRLETRIGDPIETHKNIGLLPLTSCGNFDGSRIIHGRIPDLYELPWMALISFNKTEGLEFGCAGSVINSKYILTAAHCVTEDNTFKNIAGVRIGDFDYLSKMDCVGDSDSPTRTCESRIQDMAVEEIIPHQSYTGQVAVEGDIALLRLKEAIVMTNNSAPICLPVYSGLRNTRLAGKNATIAGWGRTENQTESNKLLMAVIPILNDDNCIDYFNRYNYERRSLTEYMFCAGDMIKDSCNGDSGGPLIVESDFKNQVRMVQYGIVSFGSKECGSQFPGFYTNVSKYMQWILDHIRD